MKFFISIDVDNAEIPVADSGGWTPDTLRGIRAVLNRAMERMERYDDVSENLLDVFGNTVGTARFIAGDDDLLVLPVDGSDSVEGILDGVVTQTDDYIRDSIF